MRILVVLFAMLQATNALASDCDNYDRAIGRQMSVIASKMHGAYVAGKISSLFYDTIVTEMNRTYNNHYQMLFQKSARTNPAECAAIGIDGLTWVAGYAERVDNELNPRN